MLSILYSTRALRVKHEADWSTVTAVPNCSIPSDLQEFIPSFWDRFLGQPMVNTEFLDYHISTKAGPNGQALASSITDLMSLPLDIFPKLVKLGGEKLLRTFTTLMKDKEVKTLIKGLSKPKIGNYRKLVSFPDKEGKARVIAILDYWSQTALKSLHDSLFRILKEIPTDCTFNQAKHKSGVLGDKGPYFSYDLSAATDRFPVRLQEMMLAHVIGVDKARAWRDILTAYSFQSEVGPIKYGAGQPMGAHSSWCVFSLCHHLVVQYAAWKCNKFPLNSHYCLLGDDIVISDSDVAREYKEVLSLLDVPISEQKTHVSDDTYEFAKRWMHKGNDISPFPLAGLVEVFERSDLTFRFFQDLKDRNLSISHESDPRSAVLSLWT